MSTMLPPAAIVGVGAITPIGRDLSQIAGALARPPVEPERMGDGLCRRVAEDLLADPATSRQMRRAGRYPRMAAIAAADAMMEANGVRTVAPERTGLIVATGLGPHVRTFRFLDGILDCGDNAALPTDFSHSVHGAAASYIAEMLGIRGPVCTVTDFEVAFVQAVQLAQCWLAMGDCDRVVVGSVEELGEVLLHVVPRLVPDAVVGEGAVSFVLETGGSGMLIDAAEGLRLGGRDVKDVWPHFGQMATGRAMQLLAAALSTRAR
jgi:3-oxoacyl-[acyl-carrier-protein] synthase II